MKILLTTGESKNAKQIAKDVVEKKLAACVNIIPVNSVYWWKGNIERTKETLLILKTKNYLIKKLIKRIEELHNYDQPVIEVIEVKTTKGVEKWLNEVL